MLPNAAQDELVQVEKSVFRFRPLRRFSHLVHGVSRRRSPELTPERELNLDYAALADSEHALRHRILFCNAIGVPLNKTLWFDPSRGGPVVVATREMWGQGARDWDSRITNVSGLVTDDTDVYLATLIADNAAVMIFDPRWYVTALVSVDPSTADASPIVKAVEMMEALGAMRSDMSAVIPPSLGPCCRTFPDPALVGSHKRTNLWDLARSALSACGLRSGNIYNSRLCTACKPFDFYSRQGGGIGCGAGAAVIGVDNQGNFADLLGRRRVHVANQRNRTNDDESALARISLTEDEHRLNRRIRCPYGHNKVYIRSVLTGESQVEKPELALRCAVMEYVGIAHGGHNVVDRAYIEKHCAGDFESCRAFEELRGRQARA